jgi:Ca2+-binding EF-hand superfamily protein
MNKDEEVTVSDTLRRYQELLFKLLSRIQEYGVASYQHIKNPSLFSGSWMEKVQNVDDLINTMINTSAHEAIMRVFNILSPYKKPLPTGTGKEDAVAKFYEEKEISSPKKEVVIGNVDRERYIAKLESEIRNYQVFLTEKDMKIKELEERIQEQQILEAKEEEPNKEIEILEKQVQTLTEELEKVHNQAEELLILTNNKYIELQTNLNNLEQANKQVADLQQQLNLHKDTDHTLRFKAGQIFLDSINQHQMMYQLKDIESKGEVSGVEEYDPMDDYVIMRLQRLIEGSLQQRLLNIDNTGVISLGQFTKFLEMLQVPPQDVMTLVKVAHSFEDSNGKINTKEFVEHINKRHILREEWEKELLKRVLDSFKQISLDIEDIFAFFDNNKDGTINFEELVTAFNTLKITLSRQDLKGIFTLLDKDMNGIISLEEFQDRLLKYSMS